jgi:hypothetical protein
MAKIQIWSGSLSTRLSPEKMTHTLLARRIGKMNREASKNAKNINGYLRDRLPPDMGVASLSPYFGDRG